MSFVSSGARLTVEGVEVGECRGRWFSESMDLELRDGRRYSILRKGFWGGEFRLEDESTGEIFARASRAGLFSGWDLELSVGKATLKPTGLLRRKYTVVGEDGRELAGVRSTGFFATGWLVENLGELSEEDLLLLGILYHVLARRRRRAS